MSVSLALTSRNVHRTINRTSRHYAGALPERPIQLPTKEIFRQVTGHFSSGVIVLQQAVNARQAAETHAVHGTALPATPTSGAR